MAFAVANAPYRRLAFAVRNAALMQRRAAAGILPALFRYLTRERFSYFLFWWV